MNILNEVVALWRLRYRTPNADRTITFYSEHESYYAYFDGLLSAINRQIETKVCYITSDPDDPILTNGDRRVHAFYLNKLLPFFMKMVECKIFVMTLTDLDQYHLMRSTNDVHYVYVFHAMNSIHMCYRHGAFDHYDSIFCTGPYQIKELQREAELRNIRPRQLVEAGYSRVERIHSAWIEKQATKQSRGRTILIAPSWAANNVLESYGIELVNSLLSAGLRVIVRPHPETSRRFPKLLAKFEASYGEHSDFLLERSVRTDESLLAADVLITDWSGIALEYAFGTERPVLYIDVPRKVHNDRYEELGIEPFEASMREKLGLVVPPEELGDIVQKIEQLITDHSMYRDRIVNLRSKHVFNFGNTNEVGAAHIRRLLNADTE